MKQGSFDFRDQHNHFIMLGDGHIPAFFYDGDPPIIFDPGISAFGPFYLKKIEEIIEVERRSLPIFLTHSHFDHCGATPYLLKKLPFSKVCASVRAAAVLQKPSAIALMNRFNAEYEQAKADELRAEDVSFSGIMVDQALKQGDQIRLSGGNYAEVLETPGHTRDCLSYYFRDSGVLVAGEAAGVPEGDFIHSPLGDFIHSPFLSDYEEYVHSIEKIRKLNPEGLCIAHVGILTGDTVSQYLTASLEAAHAYKTMIIKYLAAFEGEQDKVVQKITAEQYDSKSHHIINRGPFMANLQAMVKTVAKFASIRHG
jgi:glyoxylase-like metal-dependent hydrolase (beta-lactamase superfamily II)